MKESERDRHRGEGGREREELRNMCEAR